MSLKNQANKKENSDTFDNVRSKVSTTWSTVHSSSSSSSSSDDIHNHLNLDLPFWLPQRLALLNLPYPTLIQGMTVKCLRDIYSNKENNNSKDKIVLNVMSPTGTGKTLSFITASLSLLSSQLQTVESNFIKKVLKEEENSSSGYDERKPLILVIGTSKPLAIRAAMDYFIVLGGEVAGAGGDKFKTDEKKVDKYSPGRNKNLFKYQGPKGIKVKCVFGENEDEEDYANKADKDGVIDGELVQNEDTLGKSLKGVDVIILTSAGVKRLLDASNVLDVKSLLNNVECLIVDEADFLLPLPTQSMHVHSEPAVETLIKSAKLKQKYTILLGATLTPQHFSSLIEREVLPRSKVYNINELGVNVQGVSSIHTPSEGKKMIDEITKMNIKTLTHRILRSNPNETNSHNTRLLGLIRQIRRDHTTSQHPKKSLLYFSQHKPGVFGATRDALWGTHTLKILERESLDLIMEEFDDDYEVVGREFVKSFDFDKDNTDASANANVEGDIAEIYSDKTNFQIPKKKSKLLVCTDFTLGRGLDFKDLTDVYIFLSEGEAKAGLRTEEYIHFCGRVSRVGIPSADFGGRVTTVVGDKNGIEQVFIDLGLDAAVERIENAEESIVKAQAEVENLKEEIQGEAMERYMDDLKVLEC